MSFGFRMFISLFSFLMAAVIGFVLIPYLKKIHFGQTILEDGPKWHEKKQGTPIMGGFMFIISSIVTAIVGYIIYRNTILDMTSEFVNINSIKLFSCIIYALLLSSIGFVDDYIKAVKKRNMGLNAKQKLIFQFLFSGAFLAILYALGDKSTEINLIFVKLNFGVFYYPIMILFMTYLANAVNITDGIDGLCGSITAIVMLVFTTILSMLQINEIAIYALAIAGACLGFLVWNYNPAKCFMGDTGSMYLGGAFVAIGMITKNHLLIVLIGIVYVCEALSVVMQVTYFKITAKIHYKKTGEKGKGKRIFKMSPIHHHFEMIGFNEYKIVATFSIVAMIAGVCAVLIVK